MQVSRGTLDIKVFVLPSPAFRAENCASMDLFKVAVGEFIPSLGIFPFFIVDPEVPIAVLEKPVLLDELILFCCRWLMLTPRVSIVDDNFSVGHELFGVIESTLVQLYCHDSYQFLGIAFILNQYAHDLQCAHRRFDNLMPGRSVAHPLAREAESIVVRAEGQNRRATRRWLMSARRR
jgi:hypothetical protein